MKARDVMVSPVITVNPNSSIREVAKKLLETVLARFPWWTTVESSSV